HAPRCGLTPTRPLSAGVAGPPEQPTRSVSRHSEERRCMVRFEDSGEDSGKRPPYPLHRQTILIVEDQSVQAEMLTRLLGPEGLDIDVVDNGEAALQAVARRPPDLVLLDVVLPGLDGVEI